MHVCRRPGVWRFRGAEFANGEDVIRQRQSLGCRAGRQREVTDMTSTMQMKVKQQKHGPGAEDRFNRR